MVCNSWLHLPSRQATISHFSQGSDWEIHFDPWSTRSATLPSLLRSMMFSCFQGTALPLSNTGLRAWSRWWWCSWRFALYWNPDVLQMGQNRETQLLLLLLVWSSPSEQSLNIGWVRCGSQWVSTGKNMMTRNHRNKSFSLSLSLSIGNRHFGLRYYIYSVRYLAKMIHGEKMWKGNKVWVNPHNCWSHDVANCRKQTGQIIHQFKAST